MYQQGDEVYVFHTQPHAAKADDPRYIAVTDPRQGSFRPRIGISDGWVPARVVWNTPKSAATVCIEFKWHHFFSERGRCTKPDDGYTEEIPKERVRSFSDKPLSTLSLHPPNWTPELGIIAFRWGGKNSVLPPEQWGETGSSSSDLFLKRFLEMGIEKAIGFNYEVWSVFIEDRTDLDRIANMAHYVFGAGHPVRRAKKVCAMYCLYPTGFEEGCVPNSETGEDGGAALVNQKSLFKCMQSIERLGVPTRFPHPSGLYEQLASKRWTHNMSLVPQFRVPPTVSLPRMLVEESRSEAANRAFAQLNACKRAQVDFSGQTGVDTTVTKGVAKLGFSWEALDVKFWEGRDGLEEALHNLTQTIEISGELTGQCHDLEGIMVQEYVPHNLELRLYVVEGKVEAAIYTKFSGVRANKEFCDFSESFDEAEAADKWMEGDLKALQDGDARARQVTAHWMQWVQGNLCEMPPAIRFDYFIRRTGPGTAQCWTLEICELGFSMLGEPSLPQKVFSAMARNCLGLAKSGGTYPQQVVDPISVDKQPNGVSDASPKRKPSASSSTAEDPVNEEADQGDKNAVYISVPRQPDTSADQEGCTGLYLLDPKLTAQGSAVYTHEKKHRYLYKGKDNYYYVGDDDELSQKFKCCVGYIRTKAPAKVLPKDWKEAWERIDPDDADGDKWFEDPLIISGPSMRAVGLAAKKSNGCPGKGKNKRR